MLLLYLELVTRVVYSSKYPWNSKKNDDLSNGDIFDVDTLLMRYAPCDPDAR